VNLISIFKVHVNQFGRIKEEGNKKNKNRRKQKNKKKVCRVPDQGRLCRVPQIWHTAK